MVSSMYGIILTTEARFDTSLAVFVDAVVPIIAECNSQL